MDKVKNVIEEKKETEKVAKTKEGTKKQTAKTAKTKEKTKKQTPKTAITKKEKNDTKIILEKKDKIEDNISNGNKKKSILKNYFILNIILIISLICINVFVLKPNWYYVFFGKLKIKQITINSYNEENDIITFIINVDNTLNKDKIKCYLSLDKNISEDDKVGIVNNNKCEFATQIKDYYVILENNNNIIVNIKKLTDYVNKPFYIKLTTNKLYLAVGGEQQINASLITIKEIQSDIIWTSENNSIATVKNGKITGVSNGTTNIVVTDSYGNSNKISVVVTNLIDNYVLRTDKKLLKGEIYTLEEATLLDEILAARVRDAGFGTRAGAVAAARFLTLEFQYSIPYFFENGRLNSSGTAYVDGEGRYYHIGLYLHKSKFETIEATYVGPAIWGMPLTNFENAGRYVKYAKMPNGLDCSGFVSWAVYNGGFDPGDYGAGEDPEIPNQMTDLGEYTRITKKLLDSGTVKAGDLINWKGHIGIIIGIDGENYYVAETLDTYGKLVVRTYKKSRNLYPFDHIVLMDSYYKEDGNYTQMWKIEQD